MTGALAIAVVWPAWAGREGNFGEAQFSASINLFRSIQLRKITDLNFGDVIVGTDKKVVINAEDAGAATFEAHGDQSARVIGRVQESSISMTNTNSKGSAITVDGWSYGGNMDKNGAAQFDKNGDVNDLRIGASAHVTAENDSGSYVGQATFRLTYV